jgi:hypothetical protein
MSNGLDGMEGSTLLEGKATDAVSVEGTLYCAQMGITNYISLLMPLLWHLLGYYTLQPRN